jgi:hypothetical protein
MPVHTKAAPDERVFLYARRADVNDATSFYIDTIAGVLRGSGRQLIHTDDVRNIPWRADVLVVNCKVAIMIHLLRPRSKVWLWLQGIVPEETELHMGSTIRKMYWTIFERVALPRANGIFMVSEAMRTHYANKYKFSNLPTFIMPCVNQELNAESFVSPMKYSQMRFAYAGSLHKWQCIDETLDSYSLIKKRFPSASLTFLTSDRAKATEMIESRKLQDVEVEYCKPSELQGVLAGFKYGFALRQAHPVNTVATPTKVSSYMAAGVIPILTTAVSDFTVRLSGVSPMVMLEEPDPQLVLDGVCRIEANSLDPTAVFHSYVKVFEEYFDLQRYSGAIQAFFRETGMAVNEHV